MGFPEPHTAGHRVYSKSGSDGFGNPVESWAAAVTVAVYGTYPGTPGEDYEIGRVSSKIPLMMLGTATALGGVKARDRMVWLGVEYEVDGVPENYNYGPFSYTPGVRLRLIRVEA